MTNVQPGAVGGSPAKHGALGRVMVSLAGTRGGQNMTGDRWRILPILDRFSVCENVENLKKKLLINVSIFMSSRTV